RSAVTGLDLVEALPAVGDQPGEDVDSSRRALRVRLAADVVRKVEAFDERDEVRPVRLEDRAIAGEVDLAHHEVVQALFDSVIAPWQEAATQPVGHRAQMQVEARRLDGRPR